MTKIIALRELDGSVRYSHCYSEVNPTHPCFQRKLHMRLMHPTRPMRRTRLFCGGFAVAAAMFWATMLVAPPTSDAGVSSPASSSCIERGRVVSLWFKEELPRRTWAGKDDQEFNRLLTRFNAATNQCAAGLAESSAENFRALEDGIASVEDRRQLGDDGE